MSFQPHWIVGKTVAKVDMGNWRGDGDTSDRHDPTIWFTDGSSIGFLTEESESLSYGTDIIYRPRR